MSTLQIPWNPNTAPAAAAKLLTLNPRCKCYFTNSALIVDSDCPYKHWNSKPNPPGVSTKTGFDYYDLE